MTKSAIILLGLSLIFSIRSAIVSDTFEQGLHNYKGYKAASLQNTTGLVDFNSTSGDLDVFVDECQT